MDLNFFKFEQTMESVEPVSESTTKDIAIIGMAARLPMAKDINTFWDNLANGKDCISEFPSTRQKDADKYASLVGISNHQLGYNQGAYLTQVDTFDFSFFKISPKEAILMSPDQRIFLETAWHAIEDSGYGNDKLRSSNTGLYLGYSADALFDYKRLIEKVNPELLIDALPGNLSSIIPGRISYLLDLKGPSMCIDTACSSSLVAIHLACRALRSMECEIAIAGSIKTSLLPVKSSKKLGIESSDGRAKTFDDSSDGTGMGEGAAAVILKPLNRAQRDGDHIYAVIKGSAVNQDGNSIGLTAPNATAQRDVIISAWEDSGINPESISYVEAHGTGTQLGDPIEIDGITRAFRKYTDKKQFCAIGSLKTNLGHLDCAAGIVGLIKAALCLKNKKIPPSLHFNTPNKKINFEESPVYVNRTLSDWNGEYPRRCGISAFGLSGTNCHIILEEAPHPDHEKEQPVHTAHVLTLSAKSEHVLKQLITAYSELLAVNKSIHVEDICYTANTGRGHYPVRLALLFNERDILSNALKKLIRQGLSSYEKEGIFYSGNIKSDENKSDTPWSLPKNFGRDELTQICTAYVNGENIDWSILYKNRYHNKISLPVYPFEEKRCWLEVPSPADKTEPNPVNIRLHGRDNGNYSKEEKFMSLLWCNALGYDEINISHDFYELGGDSIIAIQIANEYKKQTGTKLDASEILEHSSILSLSSHLESKKEIQEKNYIPLISRGETKEYYPLSSSQKRLYILNQFEGIGTSYNMPMAISVEGKFELEKLKEAIDRIIERHAVFRTSFHIKDNSPVQKVHEKVGFTMEVAECSNPENVPELIKSFIKPFDLEKPPLFRAKVIKINDEKCVLFFDTHHIVTDGTSSVIFDKELAELYHGKEPEDPKVQYADYAVWQNIQLEKDWMKEQEAYWLKQFEDDIPILHLPTDFPRPSIQSFEGDRVIFVAGSEFSERIFKLSEKTGTTLYMVLMSAYKVLLSKYAGQEDIIVASPFTERKKHELENVIGMFVNTAAIRSKPLSTKTFSQYLQEIKQLTTAAYANSDYPFENLVTKLGLHRDMSRTPLFDTMLTLQNTEKLNIEVGSLKFSPLEFENRIAKFDLNLNVSVHQGQIKFDMEYCTKLFKRQTIKRLMQHFMNIFDRITANPEIKLGEINILSDSEYQMMISKFNYSQLDYPKHMFIHKLFQENARKNPNNIAVEIGNEKTTYAQLDARSSLLSRLLKTKGVEKDSIVAIISQRSIELPMGILAILKAGGAYLPIDPIYPDDRIVFMLQDSSAQLVLTQSQYLDRIRQLAPNMEIINLEDTGLYCDCGKDLYLADNGLCTEGSPGTDMEDAEDIHADCSNLAYVIYTSGSTGRPKGVMIEHRSLMNFLFSIKSAFNDSLTQKDKCLSLTSISFDVSVCEIFLPLAFGAALVLYDEEMLSDVGHLTSIFIDRQITFSYIPPSVLPQVAGRLMEYKERLKLDKMLVGVEPIKDYVLETFKKLNPAMQIINGYGPTETTICATFYPYTSLEPCGRNVPIGSPLPNTRIYILDKDHNPLPLGIPGELCIAGEGVSRGYLNNPGLTKEKFVPCPFEKDRMMYRTGDLAKWLDDGSIEFVGRLDNQVKIRGYRIEPGEIESQLLKHKEVKEAVVLLQEDETNNQCLCAYIVSHQPLSTHEIRQHLSKQLPDYMIPSHFLQLEKIPLTSNGKIDRKALLKPDGSLGTGTEYIPPSDRLEEKLVSIWHDILKVKNIGIHHDFFELGGHSLKAAELISRIEKELNVKVPLKQIFQHPTIKETAEFINTAAISSYESIPRIEVKEYYELSSSQTRLFILSQQGESEASYHITNALIIDGYLNKDLFEQTIHQLIYRHESLRTSFEFTNGQPVQKIHEEVTFQIEYIELDEGKADKESPNKILNKNIYKNFNENLDETLHENLHEILKEFIKPFDLSKAPMLRVTLIKLGAENHVLLFDMHHLISDGVSMGILIREFASVYHHEPLPPLRIQYKDFVLWQNTLLRSEALKKQEEYWANKLNVNLPVLTMPLDYKRPKKRTFNGDRVKAVLPRQNIEKLNTLSKSQGTTLHTVMFAVYSLLLSQYSGQDEVMIGSLTAGRSHPDLENMIGVFMNFLPVRINVSQTRSFLEHLEETKKELLLTYENQGIPFDKMLENINSKADYSRNPIFDTMLVFHNELVGKDVFQIGDLTLSNLELENKTSTLDVKLDIIEKQSGDYELLLQYNTDLFKKQTSQHMLTHFNVIVDKVLHGQDWKISELQLFSPVQLEKLAEKRKLNDVSHATGKGTDGTEGRYVEDTAKDTVKMTVSATFTAEPIGEYVKWWCKQFEEVVSIQFAPYNQVFQQLLDPGSLMSLNTGSSAINLILVRFEDWIRDDESTDRQKIEKLDRNLNDMVQILINKDKAVPYFIGIFPVSTHLPLSTPILKHLEDMNIRWYDELEKTDDVFIIDFRDTASLYGIRQIFDAIKDREGHLPFSDEYYAAMGTMVARKICTYRKQPFKVIVLDCDNSLWKGICGEDGATGVTVEKPYALLQKWMLHLQTKGLLLALCSKNNEQDVWEVFEKNTQMILKKEHFAGWKINWKPKSDNIKELAEELNLSPNSFIFIDDSPWECSEVGENCPGVLPLNLPSNPDEIPVFLEHVWAFDILKVTSEDQVRTSMYTAESKRKLARDTFMSQDEFLKSLDLKMSMNIMNESQVDRVAQLTQRTNQFNVSTLRRTTKDILALIQNPEIDCWVLEALDRFGDYGLAGVVITEKRETALHLDTFLLSCRVMGRGLENAVLTLLKKQCLENHHAAIETDFYPTEKNHPVVDFFERTKWEKVEDRGKYIRYRLSIENIPDTSQYVHCCYKEALERQYPLSENLLTGDPALVHRFESNGNTALAAKTPGVKLGWKIPVENNKDMLHAPYLLPLMYPAGSALLNILAGEESQPGFRSTGYSAPSDELQKKLAHIWEQLIGAEQIGILDNFFDLGGNSLKATTLISRIHKEFNIELTLIQIFDMPTVAKLAELIREKYESMQKNTTPAENIHANMDRRGYVSIPRVEEKEYYVLSPAQRRIYLLNQLEDTGISYNMPAVLTVEGYLNEEKLQTAFNRLALRHETIRTSFQMIDGQPLQKIHPDIAIKIEKIEVNEYDTGHDNPIDIDKIVKEFVRPFDLSKAPLIRIRLIKQAETKYILLFDMHHIISDGTSMGIFIREILALYAGSNLPELEIQYKDYSSWQNQRLETIEPGKQEDYWKNLYAGEIPVLNMPADCKRPPVQSFEGASINFGVGRETTEKLYRIAQETETTLFMVLLTAYYILLNKYTGQEDIIIGTPIAGRHHADTEDLIGMFVNTLPLRNYPQGEKTFHQFLLEVKQYALDAFQNQDYPFEVLVNKLEIKRDLSRNPLFDTMFVLQNTEAVELQIEGLVFKPYGYESGISKFDITLHTFERDQGIYCSLEYCTKLFCKEKMERLSTHYQNILHEIVENIDTKISKIEMLDENEKNQILHLFNHTKTPYPKDKTLHELFENQVEKTPHHIAAIFEGHHLNYQQLNHRSNQLARVLREKGVHQDSIVGVILERSLEMSITLMAVLKAGGAYLPISTETPADRIKFMLEDSNAAVLITTSCLDMDIGNPTILKVFVDNTEVYEREGSNLEKINTSKDLAYIIYTSGSTGAPKGVMIEHSSLVNRLNWMQKMYPIGEGDVILQKTPYTFDVSVWEQFWWAIQGAGVCFLEPGGEKDPEIIVKAIEENKITTIHFVPSMLNMFLEYIEGRVDLERLSSLKQVFASGEALELRQVKRFNNLLHAKNKTRLHNLYGPTEATIDVSYFDCSTQKELDGIPIGKPIDNTHLYIVDKYDNLSPVGVPGELCIAGDGLARGYLNRPDLTKEKFVPNPFASLLPSLSYPKMYRTGDLAKWLADGNIEYLGRLDYQVKIRGFRIELGEIEAHLLKHKDLREAIVLAKEDQNRNKYLCAYVSSENALNVKEIREHLLKELPDYMVPSHFVHLEKLPLTSNGKVDRKALPEPDGQIASGVEYVDTRNGIEYQIAKIWEEVLDVQRVGIFDNFFEIGGNSLKAIELMGKLHRYHLSFKDLVNNPTVAQLAACVNLQDDKEITAFPQHMRENLSMEYYYDNAGVPNPLLELLGCETLMIYYAVKKNFRNFNRFWELLFQDVTFYLEQNEDGTIHFINLCMLPYPQHLVTINNTRTQGYDGIVGIEQLIDSGEIVIVDTYNNRLPYFVSFQSFDAVVDETPEDLNEIHHTFLIIAYDEQNMYYVEEPGSLNWQNYTPYKGNKSVGIIKKEELLPAFNVFVNYATLSFNEKVLMDGTDIKESIRKSIINYYQKPHNYNGMNAYYGIDAIGILIDICRQGKMALKEITTKYKELNLIGLFNWRFRTIANRRRYLGLMLKEYEGQCNEAAKKRLICLCEEIYHQWMDARMFLQKQYKRGNYYLDSGLIPYLEKLKAMEKDLIAEMGKLLE